MVLRILSFIQSVLYRMFLSIIMYVHACGVCLTLACGRACVVQTLWDMVGSFLTSQPMLDGVKQVQQVLDPGILCQISQFLAKNHGL